METKDTIVPFFGRVGVIEKGTTTENIRKTVMEGREMRILPASVWESFSWSEVRLLLHETGTYVVPTEELIEFLDGLIGEESAIEICAGNGFIGRELGIPVTDSYQQQDDPATSLYTALQDSRPSSTRRMLSSLKPTRRWTSSARIPSSHAMLPTSGGTTR